MVIYPYKGAVAEPSAVLKGELHPHFDKDRDEDEVVQTVRDLAKVLQERFNQTRVLYSFMDRQYSYDPKNPTE